MGAADYLSLRAENVHRVGDLFDDVHVMRCGNDRFSGCVLGENDIDDIPCRPRIETGRRLIQEQRLGLCRQDGSDGRFSLFSDAKLMLIKVQEVVEIEISRQYVETTLRLHRRYP